MLLVFLRTSLAILVKKRRMPFILLEMIMPLLQKMLTKIQRLNLGQGRLLKKMHNKLSDQEVYEEVTNDPCTLKSTISTVLNKMRICSDLSADTLEYFSNKDPSFARLYLLPNIHKSLHNVTGLLHGKHVVICRESFATSTQKG